jgi:hypothetical protein
MLGLVSSSHTKGARQDSFAFSTRHGAGSCTELLFCFPRSFSLSLSRSRFLDHGLHLAVRGNDWTLMKEHVWINCPVTRTASSKLAHSQQRGPVWNMSMTTRTIANATLQRQYQLQQQRFARRRNESLLCYLMRRCSPSPSPTPPARRNGTSGIALLMGLVCLMLSGGLWFSTVAKAKRTLVTTPGGGTGGHGGTTTPPLRPLKVSSQIVLSQHQTAATQYHHSSSQTTANMVTRAATTTRTTKTTTAPIVGVVPEYNDTSWIEDYLNDIMATTPASNDSAHRPHENGHIMDRGNKKKDILMWTCAGGGCGGIGDRLFGILQAFCMAVCLDRILVVDWEDDENVQFFPHHKHPLSSTPISTGSSSTRRSSSFRAPDQLFTALDDRTHPLLTHLTGLLDLVVDHSSSLSRTSTGSDAVAPHVIGIKTNLWMGADIIRQYKCWNPSFRLNDDDVLTTILRHLVRVMPAVTGLAQSIQDDAHLSSSSLPYLAVHLRTGHLDGTVNHFTQQQQQQNWTAVVECALRLCDANNGGDSRVGVLPVYVASDDEALKHELARQFQSQPQFRTSLLKAANDGSPTTMVQQHHYVDPIHHDIPHDSDRGRGDTGVVVTARRRAWAEWYVLAQATCVVPTHLSKYSLSASLYAGCAIAMNDLLLCEDGEQRQIHDAAKIASSSSSSSLPISRIDNVCGGQTRAPP